MDVLHLDWKSQCPPSCWWWKEFVAVHHGDANSIILHGHSVGTHDHVKQFLCEMKLGDATIFRLSCIQLVLWVSFEFIYPWNFICSEWSSREWYATTILISHIVALNALQPCLQDWLTKSHTRLCCFGFTRFDHAGVHIERSLFWFHSVISLPSIRMMDMIRQQATCGSLLHTHQRLWWGINFMTNILQWLWHEPGLL